MIYAIRGLPGPLQENTAVIEDRNGISWELEVSSRTRNDIHSLISSDDSGAGEIQLYTHLYHREDQMTLFGFSSIHEKQLFLLLNKVNGVGPRQSMKILSAVSPSEISRAIAGEDEGFLTSLPGIGLKGAKKIILTLKDQMLEFRTAGEADGEDIPTETPGVNTVVDDQLSQALVDMGFDKKSARVAVQRILKENPSLEQGEALRQAIIELS
ncbi:Holliday junction branch migration protein RuvA [Salinispira pacifica]|uniref:Holliday junction branch migration complex subunit RuvA n=1 Tax=Salinispira pacifica TaxID=1307761 RepID=V5WHB9_9SPIO|nr:Holliday junction branch migration protein RuvA [Salinispira pacifica]AHC15203.1 hypothetical protein L21SP2_1828 [Salinispira pacifica]